MSKVSFNTRLSLGLELVNYLTDRNVDLNKMSVKEFETRYCTDFKSHKEISGVTSLPAFVHILQPLQVTHNIQLRRGMIMLGRKQLKHSKSPSDGARGESFQHNLPDLVHSGKDFSVHRERNDKIQDGIKPKRRRSRHRPNRAPPKLAVDQHLVINQPVEEVENEATVSGDKLPRFIHIISNLYQCVACGVSCTSKPEMEKHVIGRRHRVAEVMHGLRNRREDLVQDKGDVKIISEHDLEKGVIEIPVEENEIKTIYITIHNTSKFQSVVFDQCEMLKRIRIFQLDDIDKVTEGQTKKVLAPDSRYLISVQTQARNVGSFHTPLAFRFHSVESPEDSFHIVRYLHARCQNTVTQSLKPTQKFKRPPRKAFKKPASEIIDGYKLPSLVGDQLEREVAIKPYLVMDSLRHIINRGLTNTKGLKQSEKIETSALRSTLEDQLSIINYQKRLTALMHCEEIQMEVDIRQYDMEEATMTVCPENKRLLVLKVPGLAENRPSVLRGDWLFIRVVDSDDKEYKGYVHEVRKNEVLLGFHKSLLEKMTPLTKFSVRFVFNRLPVKLQHRAIDYINTHKNDYEALLFPTEDQIGKYGLMKPLNVELRFYSHILVNKEQASAIKHIVSGTSRPAPYLVFGPPGTGKTFTIVEAMKQVLTCHPTAHILACTPSNNAADLITERLLDNENILGGILRLNAVSRSWKSVPDRIKSVCNHNKESGTYYYPNKQTIQKYRVIVCTAITAGRLSSARFPKGHFTHVFFDEAGHSLEPETLISVTNILTIGTGLLVLAGDQKQLGPILRSPFAIKYGLNMSLLERYMTQEDVYAKIASESGVMKYNPNVLTKLVKNYRSHADILHHPNQLFYDNELEACADKSIANMMCGWEGLPNKKFPIIFHPLYGEELREERSPSFFNPEEAYLVLQYVKDLKKLTGKYKLEDKDIGIITPYQKQVQKIQHMMSSNRWKNIRVGSVEEFQGQERKVIIVSTVRSSPEFLSLDINFKLGFLRNPKRFNVTVTRAKSLLIIIGNPNILSLDDNWSSFIDYIKTNGGVAGSEILDNQDDIIEDIIQRLKIVHLTDIDIETASHYNEQPWRKDI